MSVLCKYLFIQLQQSTQWCNCHRAVEDTTPGLRKLWGPVEHHTYTGEKAKWIVQYRGGGSNGLLHPDPELLFYAIESTL